jgi:uncharacterized protein YycO
MQPGDIVFERRDWALTNVGLPGFWPHVSLYIGTPQERRGAFGPDFEEGLRSRYGETYGAIANATVIEAVGRGVTLTTFERSADADYFAVIRPRLTSDQKAAAVSRALAFLGRPYDFDFDFITDDRLVCSELIYKAFESRLELPLSKIAGRSVASPNDFVRWFAEDPRDAEFVLFLDGHRHDRSARLAGVSEFRASWKRPRWHSFAHRHRTGSAN